MLTHHRTSRRSGGQADWSLPPSSTTATLTFVSADAEGFVLESNMPLVIDPAHNSDPSGNLPGVAAGSLTIGSVTLNSPTQPVFHTSHNATLAGTLVLSAGFLALRTASGGFVAPGTFCPAGS